MPELVVVAPDVELAPGEVVSTEPLFGEVVVLAVSVTDAVVVVVFIVVPVDTIVVVVVVIEAVAVPDVVELVVVFVALVAHCALACWAYCITAGSAVTFSGYSKMLIRARGIRPSVAKTSAKLSPGATT